MQTNDANASCPFGPHTATTAPFCCAAHKRRVLKLQAGEHPAVRLPPRARPSAGSLEDADGVDGPFERRVRSAR